MRSARHILAALTLATSGFSQMMPESGLSAVAPVEGLAGARMLGLGGRLTWIQRPFQDPRLWIDAHAVLQPLPRIFFEGGWGRASETRRGNAISDTAGNGADTAVTETRWDLTLGLVVLQGSATGYLPLVWRKVSQRHSWAGDASWTELGAGAGAMVPVRDWLSLQTETVWMWPLHAHDDVLLGMGRKVDGSHLELSLSFVAFLK